MQPTTPEQAPPSPSPRTFYQVMCDPGLSCQARVAFAFMYRPLEDYGFARFALDEIAAILGYSMRESSRTIGELEAAGILVSRLGGRGKGKIFALGPAVRGGIDAAVISSLSESDISEQTAGSGGRSGAIIGSINTPRDTKQIRLDLCGAAKQDRNLSLSNSRTIARGKLETKYDPGIANITTTIAREVSSSSSSLLKKIIAVPGMSSYTADRLLREYGVEVCARQLATLPAWQAHHDRKGDPIRDPGAFLMRAIEKGWAPPQHYTPQPWQIKHAERQTPAATSPDPPVEARRTQEQIDADRAASRERVEQYFTDLPADERDAIEKRASELSQRLAGGSGYTLMLLGAIQKHANARGILL